MRAFINYKYLLFFGQILLNTNPKNTEVLITINDKDISVDEFMNVYNKNIQLIEDEDQKGIEDYLDLFINYKLKLADAKS